LNLLLVETIGRIPQAEATNALVRRSVVADAPAVRSEAIEQLKQRPLHTFVPTLIAAASNSVMTRYQDFVRRNGGIANEHRLLQEGNGADDSVVFVLNTIGLGLTSQAASALSNDGYIVALRKGSLKNRIQTVLERTTGLANLDDPATWEKRWNDYNGWDTPAYRVEVIAPRRSFSCFPAGTPVLTMTGATPIEEIMVGDRVLSKDPATGELTYKSVQRTTQRRAAPLVEISFGAQALRTTPGHPFWVSGKGWQVAKHLERGDRLHGIDGAVTVEMVEELPATDVHNLVVNDYHNYFVGDQRLLVHDNSPLEATSSLLPGLAAEVAAKSR
jgi:hypothetical protein